MKAKHLSFLAILLVLCSCTTYNSTQDFAQYVNPFIGTGGHGHTYPGAVAPFGMIQNSPDTPGLSKLLNIEYWISLQSCGIITLSVYIY